MPNITDKLSSTTKLQTSPDVLSPTASPPDTPTCTHTTKHKKEDVAKRITQLDLTRQTGVRCGILTLIAMALITEIAYLIKNFDTSATEVFHVSHKQTLRDSERIENTDDVLNMDNCGTEVVKLPQAKILGGKSTPDGINPWLVFISSRIVCSGSLITHEWIISAAHCVTIDKCCPNEKRKYIKETTILAAYSRDSSEEHPNTQKRSVRYVVIHKMGSIDDINDIGFTQSVDVALFRLVKPFTINEFVRPICLYQIINMDSSMWHCKVAGYGDPSAVRMQLTNVTAMWRKTSRKCLSGTKMLWQMCAFFEEGSKVCPGDSGGPLQCALKADVEKATSNTDVTWRLVGVLQGIYGKCVHDKTPGVYTSISYVGAWVANVVEKNEPTHEDYIFYPRHALGS